jgi:hypothetical protein
LELLRDALPTSVPRVLLTEEIWGSLIGMFEINNLDLCVPSPIERFFTAVDEMPEDARLAVTAVTQPLRDALGSASRIELEVCTFLLGNVTQYKDFEARHQCLPSL